MTAPTTLHFSRAETLCLTAVLLLAFGASLGMAFNIDAIALAFGTSNADAGLVASIEMAAIAVGNLFTARRLGRIPDHRLYLIGALVIATMNALSVLAPSLPWLIALRLPAGLMLGAIVATVMGTAGRSATPEQTFGLINASVGAMGIFLSFLLPRAMALGAQAPAAWNLSAADGLYLTYTIAALAALAFIRLAPAPGRPPAAADSGESGAGTDRWRPLFGLGILFFGHALLAVFLVRIGREAGLDGPTIGYVLMAGGAVAIVAPLVTGQLGARLPSVPIVLSLVAALLVLAIGLPHGGPCAFALIAPVFAALPIGIMPVFLGAAAKVDPTGGITAAHPAFVMLGSAAAPLIGGWLSDLGSFALNGYGAAACFVVAILLALPMLRAGDRLERSGSAAATDALAPGAAPP